MKRILGDCALQWMYLDSRCACHMHTHTHAHAHAHTHTHTHMHTHTHTHMHTHTRTHTHAHTHMHTHTCTRVYFKGMMISHISTAGEGLHSCLSPVQVEEKEAMFSVLAAVLHIGNVTFATVDVSNRFHIASNI